MVVSVLHEKVGSGSTNDMMVVKIKFVALKLQRRSTDNSIPGDEPSLGDVRRGINRCGRGKPAACYFKPSTKLPLELANELFFKALRSPQAYNEYVFKGIFFKGLLQSITQSMLAYWRSHKTARRGNWRVVPHR